MKQIYIFLTFLVLLALPAVAMKVDEVPNVHVADRTQYVSNPSGVLSAATVGELNRRIGELWSDTSVEFVIVAVDKVDDSMTPEDFATKLFEKWRIGKSDKDNGLLLLLSRDDHAAVIRTGYGVEGAVPDIVAGRIIRNDMIPFFRNDDYDGGIMAGADRLISIVRDPSLAAELRSDKANDAGNTGDEAFSKGLFNVYLGAAFIITVGLFVFVIYLIVSSRGLDDVDRWQMLRKGMLPSMVVAFITIGMGIVPLLLLVWKMHRVRRHRRHCPHCGTKMDLIDEVHDNDYLSPSQDLEEKLDSVDYDVWHCPKCAQTDILPYVNDRSSYKECPRCHARALHTVERRVIIQPTADREGQGVDIRVCRNCGNRDDHYFKLPKKVSDDVAAAALGIALGSAARGGGGFGGGSFGGGSFGGGMTGGGGAGGRW